MAFDFVEDPQHLIEKMIQGPSAPRYSVCIVDIATLPWDWVVAEEGKVPDALLAQGQEHGFEQFPIRSTSGDIGWRLISARVISALHLEGAPIKDGFGQLDNDIFELPSYYVPVAELFAVFLKSRAVIVYDRDDADSGSIFGLLTIADLNKRAVRNALFELLQDIETGLAELVRRCHMGSERWIKMVSEASQVRIWGRLALAKDRGIQVDPLEYAMLPDLLEVLRKSDEMRGLLELGSKAKAADSINRIIPIRNAIMHPVKSLILSPSDVASMAEAVQSATSLMSRISALQRTPN